MRANRPRSPDPRQATLIQRLFVYGTLAPGRPNHHVLADLPGDWQPASLRGKLIHKGWGAALGSPGILPRADGGIVEGYVFTSPVLNDYWAYLDAFEGDGYVRQKVTVLVNGTEAVEACVYALPPDTELPVT